MTDMEHKLQKYHNATGELLDDKEHDPDGAYMAFMSDGDCFRHDNPFVVFAYAQHMYDGTDSLTGDLNVAVTIGPADAIEKPEVDNSHIHD